MSIRYGFIVVMATLLCTGAWADDRVTVGGDVYVSGFRAVLSEPSPRDAFLSGFSSDLDARVESNVSAVGFDVDISAPVGGDLRAAGSSVNVEQAVGRDVSAAGFNLRIRKQASIGGNARLAGGSIVLDAPVSGSLVAAAGALAINGTIAGDVRLSSRKLSFGPDARIGGTLTYAAPDPVDIPAAVISADRVHFQKLEMAAPMRAMQERMGHRWWWFWPSFLGVLFGFVVVGAFLVAVAAVFLTYCPRLVENLRQNASAAPFRSIALGILGMATMIGLVPVSAMTLIGLPLIPVVLLAMIALWIAGYLGGAYTVALQVATAFRGIPDTVGARLIVLTLGLIVIALLNFIPFLGWLINLAVALLGIGAIVMQLVRRFDGRRDQPAPQADVPIPPQDQQGENI